MNCFIYACMRVCMCACVHVYMCTGTCVHVYMYMYADLCTSVCIFTCTCTCMCMCTCMCKHAQNKKKSGKVAIPKPGVEWVSLYMFIDIQAPTKRDHALSTSFIVCKDTCKWLRRRCTYAHASARTHEHVHHALSPYVRALSLSIMYHTCS